MTGRGASPSGPSKKSIEWGTALSGRWALLLVRGRGCSHGRGRLLLRPSLARIGSLGLTEEGGGLYRGGKTGGGWIDLAGGA